MPLTVKRFKEIDYIISTDDNFDYNVKHPAFIVLHGAGSRGRDIEFLKGNDFYTDTQNAGINVLSFSPQCYADNWFEIFEQLQEFIAYVRTLPYVDTTKFYIMGASLGGYATWMMAMTHPEWFAAAAPICGGGMSWYTYRLKDVPIWAFHGKDDKIVFPEESIRLVEAVNKNGGNAKLTLLDNVAHGSWDNAFSSKELFDWMLSKEKAQQTEIEDKFKDQKKYG